MQNANKQVLDREYWQSTWHIQWQQVCLHASKPLSAAAMRLCSASGASNATNDDCSTYIHNNTHSALHVQLSGLQLPHIMRRNSVLREQHSETNICTCNYACASRAA